MQQITSMLEAYEKNCNTFHLRNIQVLHGNLIHMSFVFLEGSSQLPVFSNFMSSFYGNNFAKRHLTNSFMHCLKRWEVKLQETVAFHQLFSILPLENFGLFIDASTSWGLSIVLGNFHHSLKLKSNWKCPGLDICWLKSITIKILFYFLHQLRFWNRQWSIFLSYSFLIPFCSSRRILIYADNSGAISAHQKRCSCSTYLNFSVWWSYLILNTCMIISTFCYISSDINPADMLSHGEHPLSNSTLLKWAFELPDNIIGSFINE